MSPCLEFHLDLPKSSVPSLVEGRLIVKPQPGPGGTVLSATSGTRSNQYQKSWLLKGKGPLPPSKALAPLKYTVSTQKLWLPHVKGVEGSFYAIAPFSVSIGESSRGDFGVHFDANVPGSAGCCVLRTQSHWDIFRIAMEKFRAAGFQQIPLTVSYDA